MFDITPENLVAGDAIQDLGDLLTHNAITVTIAHEGICGMAARHRHDAVASYLSTGNPAVPVVVPKAKGIDVA